MTFQSPNPKPQTEPVLPVLRSVRTAAENALTALKAGQARDFDVRWFGERFGQEGFRPLWYVYFIIHFNIRNIIQNAWYTI